MKSINPTKHKSIQAFPGINSNIMETILEMSGKIPFIDDLREIIKVHSKECLELLLQIEKEGVKDAEAAINLLLIDEAIKNLNIRRELFKKLLTKTAVIFLPLPPHLSNPFLTVADHNLIFVSDSHLPPHLRHVHYRNLEHLDYIDIERLSEKVNTVVLEGYFENEIIYVRKVVANVIFLLSSYGLKQIYIHSIPHIPPQTEFIQLKTNKIHVDITVI